MLSILKNTNLAMAFLLELCVLVALGYWGFQSGPNLFAKIALGIGAPALAVIIWALFGAPTARWPLRGFWRALLEVIWFGSGALALFAAGQRWPGIIFVLIFLINRALIYIWQQ